MHVCARVCLLLASVLATLTACSGPDGSTENMDIVSFVNNHGMACTSIVVFGGLLVEGVSDEDETDSSVDCEPPPPSRKPVPKDRRQLLDPSPGRQWEEPQLITTIDAHGRVCTLVAVPLGDGEIDEASIDCDYPPANTKPGAPERRSPPDPNPESDGSVIQIVTFVDTHGRVCTTTTAFDIRYEADLTCEYTNTPKRRMPTETAMPR
jgi:hypothetical protein